MDLGNKANWGGTSIFVLKITLFLALAAHLTSSIHMPQFFEHLARGHWIISNHSLPDAYIWSKLSFANSPWSDPNWLFEILISVCETNFGEVGLIVLKISAVFLSIYSLSLLLSCLSRDEFFGCLLAIVITSGVYVSNDLLPSCLALSLACFFFYLVAKENINALILLVLVYLCCNIDATFAILLPISLFFTNNRKSFFILLAVLLIAFLSPPYWGMQIVDGLRSELDSLSWDILLQRKAANVFDFRFAFLLLTWMLIGVVSKRQLLIERGVKLLLFVSAIFSIFGLASTDFLALGLVSSSVLLAKLWSSYEDLEAQNLALGLKRLQDKLTKISPIGIIWVFLAICIISIKPLLAYPVSYALLPKQEVDLALSRGLKLPIYHDSFVGSYLAYRFSMSGLSPAETVLATSQAEAFSAHATGLDRRSPRIEYLAQTLNPHFFEYFDFLAPKSVICRRSEPLFSVLVRDPKWKEVSAPEEGLYQGLFGWVLFERSE